MEVCSPSIILTRYPAQKVLPGLSVGVAQVLNSIEYFKLFSSIAYKRAEGHVLGAQEGSLMNILCDNLMHISRVLAEKFYFDWKYQVVLLVMDKMLLNT